VAAPAALFVRWTTPSSFLYSSTVMLPRRKVDAQPPRAGKNPRYGGRSSSGDSAATAAVGDRALARHVVELGGRRAPEASDPDWRNTALFAVATADRARRPAARSSEFTRLSPTILSGKNDRPAAARHFARVHLAYNLGARHDEGTARGKQWDKVKEVLSDRVGTMAHGHAHET